MFYKFSIKDLLKPRMQILLRDRFGGYRDPEIAILKMLPIPKNSTIIDVGANRGIWTLRMRRLLSSNGLLIAFEANKSCYQYLNEAFSSADNVKCFHLAITDKAGHVPIFEHSSETELLHSGTTLKPSGDMVLLDTVPGTSIDKFLSQNNSFQLGDVRLMKVDTEGGEIEVIKGAREVLRQFRPFLIIEILHRNLAMNMNQLLKLLDGHACYIFEDGKFLKFTENCTISANALRPRSRNYIFVPTDITLGSSK